MVLMFLFSVLMFLRVDDFLFLWILVLVLIVVYSTLGFCEYISLFMGLVSCDYDFDFNCVSTWVELELVTPIKLHMISYHTIPYT